MSTWPSEGVSVVIYSGTFVWLQKKIDPLIQEKRCFFGMFNGEK